MLPKTYNAKWIKGPKMANASHQFDGADEGFKPEEVATWHPPLVAGSSPQFDGQDEKPAVKNFNYFMQDGHEQAVEVFEDQQTQIAETEAGVGKWHPPMSVIRQKLDAIRKGLDDLEAAL